MKLEVGMYVRGKYYQYRGKIGKIIKNYNNDLEIAYKDGILKTNVGSFIDDNYDVNGKQYKASYNIIDILEVGDIIRYRIDKVSLETKGYLTGVIDITDEEMIESIKEDKNYHVLQILTKEQFEQMSYKVGE